MAAIRARHKAPKTQLVLPEPKPNTFEPFIELSKAPLTAYNILYGNPVEFGVHLASCGGKDGCTCGKTAKNENMTSFLEFARAYNDHYMYDDILVSPSASPNPTELAKKLKKLFAIVASYGLRVNERTDNEMVAIAKAFFAKNLEQLKTM